MKVIILADLHLGRSHKLVPNITELTLRAFKEINQDTSWDVMLIAGDIFETGTPHPSLIAQCMNILHDVNRPTLINYGNHDATRKGSATDPLMEMNSKHVQIVRGMGVYDVGGLRVFSHNWPQDMHKGMVRDVRIEEPHDCVMLHGSAHDHPNSPRDDWTYRVYSDKPKFFGHLHSPSMNPLGYYPGTLVPGNFNETHQAGGLIWDTEVGIQRYLMAGYPTFRTVEDSVAQTMDTKPGEVVRVVAKAGRNLRLEKAIREKFENATVDYKPPENLIRAEAVAISKATTMMETYRAYLEGTSRDTAILEPAREFLHA